MRRLAPVPFAVLLAGCPFDDEARVCTREFATVRLPVVDAAGQPAVPTSATVTRADGRSLVCPTSDDRFRSGCVVPLDAGPYADLALVEVVHDGIELEGGGEPLRVTATDGVRSGSAEVIVGDDGCYLRRLSGADRIILR